jgi:hypothetical protein
MEEHRDAEFLNGLHDRVKPLAVGEREMPVERVDLHSAKTAAADKPLQVLDRRLPAFRDAACVAVDPVRELFHRPGDQFVP